MCYTKILMNILLITIPFYDYTQKIIEKINKEMNAEVDVIYSFVNYKNKKWYEKILYNMGRCSKRFFKKMEYKRQRKNYEKIWGKQYDFIFTIVGKGLEIDLFENFLSNQKKAKKILYLWDDIKRINNYESIKYFFDRILSFDKYDCDNYGIEFLPLFYCDDFVYESEKKNIDFFFTGWLHSDRETILDNILKKYPKECYNWFALLRTSRLHNIKRFICTRKLKKFYIGFKDLSLKDNAYYMKKSKIVIDMPFESQKGLSLRTIESLAAKDKLITTNKEIMKYDFYNKNNILIIDRTNPNIPDDFINRPYCILDKKILQKYSLSNWIKEIFKS